MKIAIDARKWRDYGIGTYVRNLVRHLARIDRETTYYLFCDRSDEATLRDLARNFVPVVEHSRGYRVREHLSIPFKARRLGVDLLHTPHYVVPYFLGRPSVVTVHDCIHLLFPEYLPNRMALTYARAMMGHAIESSTLVLTVSEASRRDILRFYPRADPDRVQVVPNAIDPAILEHPGEEEMERVKERYQIRGRFVLYAGNIKPHKNLERLIEAFALVKQRGRHGDLKLLIIGDEVNKYGSLRRKVESAGVRHDVRFFGFVPDSTLAALYRLASVFAFPSLYEGFGLPPLEAMAAGTPVVTSRISSLPEVVGDAAVLVDPYSVEDIAEGLVRVLDDDALRDSLVEKGRRRATQFSWERSVQSIHDGYMRVLGVPVPARAAEQHAPLKVALVHDWLTGMRGGEKVLLSLCRLFPEAPIFTLLHARGSVDPEIEAHPIHTSFVQHLPGVEEGYRSYLPLFPAATAAFDLSGFDLVVSSSHCVAKGVRVPGGAVHVCYCHTPMRYVWDRYDDYFGPGKVTGLARLVVPSVAEALRAWDVATAGNVHRYAANSAFVAGRIRRYYGRSSVVIAPPVDTDFFTPGKGDGGGDYDLVVSALVPYKRVELILDAFRDGARRLKIVGTGPDAPRLRARAGRSVEFLGRVDDDALRDLYRGCRTVIMASVEDFGIVPLEAMACGRPAVAYAEGGGRETVLPGRTGVLFYEAKAAALRAALDSLEGMRFNTAALRAHAEAHSRAAFEGRFRAFVEEALTLRSPLAPPMLKFQTRVMVVVFVLVDVASTHLAWLLAYFLRFHSDFVSTQLPVTKGTPPLWQYLILLPVIALLWPAVLYFHGLYQVKRGRSRIDEFFGILFSVLIASALLLGTTLYVRVYYKYQPDVSPMWEYSQAVVGLFIVLDVLALNAGRSALRAYLQRMWAAGYNLKRVLIAGAGELGQQVAEAITAHRELGYRVVGFIDDAPHAAPRGGLPVLGTLDQATEVSAAHRVDQLYVALPLEEHAKLVKLVKSVRNECLDLKVVPDLIQYATIKAALEDIEGIPIIALNEVPLRGWSSMAKRVMDVVLGTLLVTFCFPVFAVISVLIKWRGGKGPVLLLQERMTLDGKTFQIYKFRTMVHEAEKETGPVWASPEDPRRTRLGILLRRFNLDELPQLINVVLGDMSLVGPRPERPPFVQQFKERIPQYMLRHRVKSGITGWAQVNGWRGNTSIEKRIEYDLYYIENWSLLLDVKILILTLFRGFGQKHAY